MKYIIAFFSIFLFVGCGASSSTSDVVPENSSNLDANAPSREHNCFVFSAPNENGSGKIEVELSESSSNNITNFTASDSATFGFIDDTEFDTTDGSKIKGLILTFGGFQCHNENADKLQVTLGGPDLETYLNTKPIIDIEARTRVLTAIVYNENFTLEEISGDNILDPEWTASKGTIKVLEYNIKERLLSVEINVEMVNVLNQEKKVDLKGITTQVKLTKIVFEDSTGGIPKPDFEGEKLEI